MGEVSRLVECIKQHVYCAGQSEDVWCIDKGWNYSCKSCPHQSPAVADSPICRLKVMAGCMVKTTAPVLFTTFELRACMHSKQPDCIWKHVFRLHAGCIWYLIVDLLTWQSWSIAMQNLHRKGQVEDSKKLCSHQMMAIKYIINEVCILYTYSKLLTCMLLGCSRPLYTVGGGESGPLRSSKLPFDSCISCKWLEPSRNYISYMSQNLRFVRSVNFSILNFRFFFICSCNRGARDCFADWVILLPFLFGLHEKN